MYNLNNGKLKGGGTWDSTYADLRSNAKAAQIIAKWKRAWEQKEMRETIAKLLPEMSHEKLTSIIKIITPKN